MDLANIPPNAPESMTETLRKRCDCKRLPPPGEPWTPDYCRLCYLAATDPTVAAIMATPAPTPEVCPRLWRRARGPDGTILTREVKTGCCGTKPLDLFECRAEARKTTDNKNDHVTLVDCQSCTARPLPKGREPLLLKNPLSPGDVLVMTGAIRSLHAAHPGRFRVAVQSCAAPLFEHNRDVVPLDDVLGDDLRAIDMEYPLVGRSGQLPVHFLHAYCDFLASKLNTPVPLSTNVPIVTLSRRERDWLPQVHDELKRPARYWVVNAGYKSCFTAKWWGTDNFQAVVDALRGRVLFVQVGSTEHTHPTLRNVLDLRGKTDLRQLVRLVHHADGAVGPLSLLMHLAAALGKPYMALAGGREPLSWNSYPQQVTFHTMGALSCCLSGPCWKSRTVALDDGKDSSLCLAPTVGDEPIPGCMAMIRPEEIIQRILLTEAGRGLRM